MSCNSARYPHVIRRHAREDSVNGKPLCVDHGPQRRINPELAYQEKRNVGKDAVKTDRWLTGWFLGVT